MFSVSGTSPGQRSVTAKREKPDGQRSVTAKREKPGEAIEQPGEQPGEAIAQREQPGEAIEQPGEQPGEAIAQPDSEALETWRSWIEAYREARRGLDSEA